MPPTSVTTYYLEMHDPRDLRPKRSSDPAVAMVQVQPPMPELNRFFYTSVGADWWWTDRLPWPYHRWHEYVKRPEIETWMITVSGVPAGYFEIEAQISPSPPTPLPRSTGGEGSMDVEIAYFGLLPQFVGKGLGSHLLTCAIERGWTMGARRVWVHTCTLDHPQALANYQARGLRLYKQETHVEEVATKSPGPWPEAFPDRM